MPQTSTATHKSEDLNEVFNGRHGDACDGRTSGRPAAGMPQPGRSIHYPDNAKSQCPRCRVRFSRLQMVWDNLRV